MSALLKRSDVVVPTAEDTQLATSSSRVLAQFPDGILEVHVDGQRLVLPKAAVRLLSLLLTEMSAGNAVTIIPIHAELTTQEAADFLNVSRPFLVSLIEKGEIEHRMVGTHRRVKFSHLEAYKRRKDEERERAMQELAAQAQELGMGY
jgi:excisionase family DNA binding protein